MSGWVGTAKRKQMMMMRAQVWQKRPEMAATKGERGRAREGFERKSERRSLSEKTMHQHTYRGGRRKEPEHEELYGGIETQGRGKEEEGVFTPPHQQT